MAIQVTFPATGFAIGDLADIVDFIAVDATVSPPTSTGFTGSGTFQGASASFSVTGSGFTIGIIGGDFYVTAGVIDTITFSTGAGTVSFKSVDIDMSEFSPIIRADETGTQPLAIETFLLNKDWDVTLGNEDDVAPKGTAIGDGADFNLRGNDIIHGRGGNDNLYSGDGADKLFGDLGRDRLDGGLGNDSIFGGAGNDWLQGGGGRDKLLGGGGKDKLLGGSQNDRLDGGIGNDVLTGGGGADKFIFRNKYGNDTITDFNATNNREDIDLSAVSRIKTYLDLVNNHMEQVGKDVVIDDHAGTTITLLNVDIDDLGKGDFLF